MPQYNIARVEPGALPVALVNFGTFDTAEEAVAAIERLRLDRKRYVPQPKADPNWRLREEQRFRDGTYTRPGFWDLLGLSVREAIADDFVHMSKKQPGKLAFTESPEKGAIDRQTVISPGRYLERVNEKFRKHHGFNDDYRVLSHSDIEEMSALCTAGNFVLKFAKTADEIEEVYLRTAWTGSCMSGPADNYESPFHPARVYAGYDLQVAYLEDPDIEKKDLSIRARCLVWPERKTRGRIYGDVAKMKAALEQVGYDVSDVKLRGARIRRVEYDDWLVVPYIDEYRTVEDHGDYLTIDGDIDAQSTSGLIERGHCDRCGDRYDPEQGGAYLDHIDQHWCENCVDCYAFYCERTYTHYAAGSSVELQDTGETVCLDWARKNAFCDEYGDWFAEKPKANFEDMEQAA